MSRLLMQHGVGQLEQLFVHSKSDAKMLKQLELELQYRQVPRAVALLAEVQAAMYGAGPAEPPATASVPPSLPTRSPATSVQQPELWARPPTAPISALAPVAPQHALAVPCKPQQPIVATKLQTSQAHGLTADEAYKLLRAAPGSTWESIERTRRQLVQQSHPTHLSSLSAEKRAQVQEEVVRVNAAYAILLQARAAAS